MMMEHPGQVNSAALRLHVGGIERATNKLIDLLAIRAAYADAEEYRAIRELMTYLRPLASAAGSAMGRR